MEGRRSEEEIRRSTRSLCSSSEGDESLNCYGPMSPTFKVSRHTTGGPYKNVFSRFKLLLVMQLAVVNV